MSKAEIIGTFPELAGYEYINLTTFRKNGVAVATPVWFAQIQDTLFIFTINNSGKVKRIRNNPQVQVAPCTSNGKPLGSTINARARIMSIDEEFTALMPLRHKYGFIFGLFEVFFKFRGAWNDRAYLAIVRET